MKAAPPAPGESSKTKTTLAPEDSAPKAKNKKHSKTSAPAKTGITRQEAKAKVAQLEQRVDRLRKDVQAVRAKKPSEEESTGQASGASPDHPASDGSPIPKAILVATPEEAHNGLPPVGSAESTPLASLEQQGSTSTENKAAPATSHAPHAVPVSPAPSTCPVAEKANMPGFVISPFPPRKLIDATNMSAGATVKDPDTGAIFRLPKDLVEVKVIVETP
jgi:hypothetical protein